MPSQALSIAEFKAMNHLAQARRGLLGQTFKGTQLVLARLPALGLAADGALGARALFKGGKVMAGAAKSSQAVDSPALKAAVMDFFRTCADVDDVQDLVAAITGDVMGRLVTEMTPILGALWSAKNLATAAKAVVDDARNLYSHAERRLAFRPGDPLAAADAIKQLIERDLSRHKVDLGRQAVATGAKIASLFTDLGVAGAVVGAANTVADLGLKLYALGLDIKDMKRGNERLKSPDTLDHTVFDDCPILGCYLLVTADTSQLANFFIADIGLPGWMDKIERLKKDRMDKLIAVARKAIDNSNLALKGLDRARGLQHKSMFALMRAKVAKAMMG